MVFGIFDLNQRREKQKTQICGGSALHNKWNDETIPNAHVNFIFIVHLQNIIRLSICCRFIFIFSHIFDTVQLPPGNLQQFIYMLDVETGQKKDCT